MKVEMNFTIPISGCNTVIEAITAAWQYDPHTNKSSSEFPNMASAGTAVVKREGAGVVLHLRAKILKVTSIAFIL